MKQISAYKCLKELKIFKHLKNYNPVLCGTYPLDLIIDSSDLDIILEFNDVKKLKRNLYLYKEYKNFCISEGVKDNQKYILSSFEYEGFKIEFFGQQTPVENQNAFLHMIIEYNILKKNTYLKEKIINLKKAGYKTEPAFALVLDIKNPDSYAALIDYGRTEGIIDDI